MKKWKKWAFYGGIILGILAIGGFLVVASGIVSIKASARHWAATRWFLNFAKERSVATHSMGIKPPDLEVNWRIMKGAGHFETGCRPCHGSPETPPPAIPHRMTPPPPLLKGEIADWKPAELFYLVKHGIKFTGMPAWPAQNRDDEVWAMTAFLRKLPSLNAESYRRLVHGNGSEESPVPLERLVPSKTVETLIVNNCARCHGHGGNGRGSGAFPKLAGQKSRYLSESLRAYASGKRHSGLMQPIAAGISPEVMRQLADYYANLPPAMFQSSRTPAFKRGQEIAMNGIPEKRVPACVDCHLAGSEEKNEHYPRLAGQYTEYIKLQLELFKSRHRGGTAYSHIMHQAAENLAAGDMEAVAEFFARISLNPEDQ